MEEMILNLEFYGYILLFFSSFGGSFLGIVAAGVLSSLGKFDLGLSIILASSGNICGSLILLFLARVKKGYFRNKHSRKIALVSLWLKRYGIALIFVNKYIYGFKSILPLVVGMSGYSVKKFMFWNVISSFVWGALMGFGGFFASGFIVKILNGFQKYPYVLPLVFFCVLAGIWFFYPKRAIKRQRSIYLSCKD